MTNKIKVLIVEDQFLAATMLSRNLSRFFGYDICGPVATGEEAIEIAAKERPDIILMDIGLASEMTGIEAAQEIKCRYAIPIIFLTGYSAQDYLTHFQELDPPTFLEKPLDPPQVDAAIESALGQNA